MVGFAMLWAIATTCVIAGVLLATPAAAAAALRVVRDSGALQCLAGGGPDPHRRAAPGRLA